MVGGEIGGGGGGGGAALGPINLPRRILVCLLCKQHLSIEEGWLLGWVGLGCKFQERTALILKEEVLYSRLPTEKTIVYYYYYYYY
ncbi:hypothetical protein M0802_011141 [Mischocyttarus mexicanus]|nr:hypothetical protein M0802_011141 [Mischocyttarus mexicanus]